MQACAVTVIEIGEDAGQKIGELAAQLQEQGYTVTSVSVSITDPAPDAAAVVAATPAASAADPVPEASADAASAEPDNSKPFKCAACGATYDAAGTCDNGHVALNTLPTEDVLAGATPEAGSPATAADTPEGGGGTAPLAAVPSPPPDQAAGQAPGEGSGPSQGGPEWPAG